MVSGSQCATVIHCGMPFTLLNVVLVLSLYLVAFVGVVCKCMYQFLCLCCSVSNDMMVLSGFFLVCLLLLLFFFCTQHYHVFYINLQCTQHLLCLLHSNCSQHFRAFYILICTLVVLDCILMSVSFESQFSFKKKCSINL